MNDKNKHYLLLVTTRGLNIAIAYVKFAQTSAIPTYFTTVLVRLLIHIPQIDI